MDRDALVESGYSIVGAEARKLASGTLGYRDLFQEGCVGLLEAADRFEPEAGAQFTSFAWPRVRGRMIDALRRERLRGMERSIEDLDFFGEDPDEPADVEAIRLELDRLRPDHAETLRLLFGIGCPRLTFRGIAARTGLSVSTVAYRAERALESLRRRLGRVS